MTATSSSASKARAPAMRNPGLMLMTISAAILLSMLIGCSERGARRRVGRVLPPDEFVHGLVAELAEFVLGEPLAEPGVLVWRDAQVVGFEPDDDVGVLIGEEHPVAPDEIVAVEPVVNFVTKPFPDEIVAVVVVRRQVGLEIGFVEIEADALVQVDHDRGRLAGARIPSCDARENTVVERQYFRARRVQQRAMCLGVFLARRFHAATDQVLELAAVCHWCHLLSPAIVPALRSPIHGGERRLT